VLDISRIQLQRIEHVGFLLGVGPMHAATTIPRVGQIDVVDAILEIEPSQKIGWESTTRR